MCEESILELIYRLSRMPIRVYTEAWEMQSSFGTGNHGETAYDGQILMELQKLLGEKETDQAFVAYHEQVPIGLYGCRAGGRIYVLGPLCYGPLHTMEAARFLRKHRLGEYPECRMEDVRNVLWFLTLGGTEKAESEEQGRDHDHDGDHDRERGGCDGRGVEGTGCGRRTGSIRNIEEGDAPSAFGVTDQESVAEEVWQREAFQRNHTYLEEEKLFSCIREGNVAYLKQHGDDIELPHPILLDDVKKNEEYMAVTGISLAARAAVEGGVSSKEAFLYNDLFLKKVAACRNIQEINQVHRECYLQMARLVRNRRKKETALNRHVEECKKAVITRRFEQISIDGLAEAVGISREYLQKLFKQYEGVSLTEYITDKKLEAACNMLVFSGRKISEIADQLHFGSVSHFSLVFKRKKGLSPKEYRQKHQRTVY